MKTMCYRCMKNTGVDGVCSVCGAPIRTQRDIGDDYLLPLGTRLDDGNIVIGDKLGRGGFGITYIALDNSQFGVIALKEFVPTYMIFGMRINNAIYIDEQKRDQYLKHMGFFRGEAITLSKLNHPNIVKVYFEFEENNTCYYGMELLKGMNLYEWINQNGTVSEADAFRLISPILDALEYIHSRNVLHRDISPGNIFLRDAPGRFMDVDPCLIDFGAAYDAQVDFSKSAPHIKSKGYSPPEQNAGHEYYGKFSDVYAISAVLYYILTRRTPPASEDRYLRGVRLIEPCKVNGGISKAFSDAIMRGMTMDSHQRTQTVTELRRELQNALKPASGPKLERKPPELKEEKLQLIQKRPHHSSEGGHSGEGPQKPQSDRSTGPGFRPDNTLLRSFLGTIADMLLFAGLWKLILSVEALSEIVNDDMWLAGVAAFIVAVICNLITSLAASGTLGECLARVPREDMDSGRAAIYALTNTIYPIPFFTKLARLAAGGANGQGETVGILQSDGSRNQSNLSNETQVVGPSLVAANPGDGRVCVKRVNLKKGGQILGREAGQNTECDVAVSESKCVSRKHCRIAFDERWYIEDSGSKNGTYVNDRVIAVGKRAPLRDGDKVSLGEEGVDFIFREPK